MGKFEPIVGASYGVKAVQIVGWNDGGQDQGNPSHDTDSRLGSFEDLRQAIKQIQELGIQVILFAKFTWADRATEWFREELRDFLWDGEFRGTRGVSVTDARGEAHEPYSVFTYAGKICVVVCNYDYVRTIRVTVCSHDGAGSRQYRLIDGDRWEHVCDTIEIPPCSAAVVL